MFAHGQASSCLQWATELGRGQKSRRQQSPACHSICTVVQWTSLAWFTASLMHTCREKQTKLQVRFDQWSQNFLVIVPHLALLNLTEKGGRRGQHNSAVALVVRKKYTAQKPFPQLMMANAFWCSGKLLPRTGQRAKSTNASSARQQMPPDSCQQVFYLPSYSRKGRSLKRPTFALTFSLGQVGPSSTSHLTSCHESSNGRCEIAGDLLASGTPVLSFWAFDSLQVGMKRESH